jgi:polyphenol oxidase
MNTSNDEAISFWQAENLARLPWLIHGFTHRTGGVSTAPYSSLNLAFHVADAVEQVKENRERLGAVLEIAPTQWIFAAQVHGGKANRVLSWEAGRTATQSDALVTEDAGILLTLFFADCVPVFFADMEKRIVGISHAGWRGLAAGILEDTLLEMADLDARPETTLAAIGPCISPEWFEVGEEVAEQFPNETLRRPEWPRPHIDLAAAARNRLLAAGIPAENIVVADECTASRPERYFSHRRDNGQTGRMAGFIGLR